MEMEAPFDGLLAIYDLGSGSNGPGEVSLVPDPISFTAEARRGKKCSFKRQLHRTHEKVRKQVTVRHTD